MNPRARRFLLAASACASVALLGWVGASAWGARRTAATIEALAARPIAVAGVQVCGLRHEGNWLESSGQFELLVAGTGPGCARTGLPAERVLDAPPAARVHYRMSHWILPGSLMRFDWRLDPALAPGTSWGAIPGGGSPAAGRGSISFAGVIRSDYGVVPLTLGPDDRAVSIAASSGSLAFDGETLRVRWSARRVEARVGAGAFGAEGVDATVELRDGPDGVARSAITFDHASAPAGRVDGFTLEVEARERGERVDLRVAPAVQRGVVAGRSFRDAGFELAARGLHAGSLGAIGAAAIGSSAHGAGEDGRWRPALRELLAHGFSVTIPKAAGAVDGGAMDGALVAELRGSQPADRPVALARRLAFRGRIAATDPAIGDERRRLLLAFGLATATPEGVQVTFDYDDGTLRANGQRIGVVPVGTRLAAIDRWIEGALAVPAAAAPGRRS